MFCTKRMRDALKPLLAAVLLMGLGTAVSADHVLPGPGDGIFELDGNIADDSGAGLPDDWSDIDANTDSAFSDTGILHDPKNLGIFTGGGSKDVRDVTQWRWTNGSVPDKDEILNAAAAAYNVEGELIIYLHGDRYANDGSAQMGVWFFQERVNMLDDGTFSGAHREGDLLMLAEFVQGGAVANVKLYKWNTGVKDNLELIAEGTGGGSDYYYATSNGMPTPAWPGFYEPKSPVDGYPANTYPENSFFEGAINVSAYFTDQALPCFSSFLMETRSSHRANAQLKDFVLGSLDTCKLSVAKQCLSSDVNTTNYVSLNHHYKYTVTNDGFGAFDSVTFMDDAGTPGDTSDDFALEPVYNLLQGDSVDGYYTITSTLNPPTNTIYATGHIGTYAMAPVEASATCSPVALSPDISVTKKCEQRLEALDGKVVVRVDYSGVVCNDQNGTKLVGVAVTDDISGEVFNIGDLYPADDPQGRDQCADFGASYYPSALVPSGTTCAIGNTHSNTVLATGTGALSGMDVNATATATCNLCDGSCTEE